MENQIRRLGVGIERLGRTQEAAGGILGAAKIHDDVEHHRVGRRHAARRPRLQERPCRGVRLCGPVGEFVCEWFDRARERRFGDDLRGNAELAAIAPGIGSPSMA
jgi:hypothetical protein